MTDSHCHPFDLYGMQGFTPDFLDGLKKTRPACAANSWNRAEFEYIECLAKEAAKTETPVIPCFGIHPQLPADEKLYFSLKDELISLLELLPAQGRIGAIGETGFDLYDERNKETEKTQDVLFALHLETAVKFSLPLVIHSRRAMHKIFPFSKDLKKLPAVVFHSWPGTFSDGEALIRRGINVYFSFGTQVVNNHKEAMRCAAVFPAERLLLETDAPYQPLKGRAFSSWEDLGTICRAVAALRKENGLPGKTPEELETLTDSNFHQVFKK